MSPRLPRVPYVCTGDGIPAHAPRSILGTDGGDVLPQTSIALGLVDLDRRLCVGWQSAQPGSTGSAMTFPACAVSIACCSWLRMPASHSGITPRPGAHQEPRAPPEIMAAMAHQKSCVGVADFDRQLGQRAACTAHHQVGETPRLSALHCGRTS